MRKNSEGTRKKRKRMPKVPTISTFKGGWERTFSCQLVLQELGATLSTHKSTPGLQTISIFA